MTQINSPLSESAPDTINERVGDHDVNIGHTERMLSVAAGAFLALYGVSRKSIPGAALALLGGGLIYRGARGHCHGYAAMGVNTARSDATPQDYFERGIHVEECYTVKRRPWELYEFWRNFENLPRIMSHLESVTVIDDKRSHWVAKAPAIAGGTVEWDAEILNDEPHALIAWRSLPGADVDNAGSVRFVPDAAGGGTDVKIVIDYIPPAGRLGSWIASLFGDEPEQQIREDLRRFKETMEPTDASSPRSQ